MTSLLQSIEGFLENGTCWSYQHICSRFWVKSIFSSEVIWLVSSGKLISFYFNVITVATFLATASVATLAITTGQGVTLTRTATAANTFLFLSVVTGMGSAVHMLVTLISGYLGKYVQNQVPCIFEECSCFRRSIKIIQWHKTERISNTLLGLSVTTFVIGICLATFIVNQVCWLPDVRDVVAEPYAFRRELSRSLQCPAWELF